MATEPKIAHIARWVSKGSQTENILTLGGFCCKDLGRPNRAGLVLVLSCQFSELMKRAESVRELSFADHVGHFDTLKRC